MIENLSGLLTQCVTVLQLILTIDLSYICFINLYNYWGYRGYKNTDGHTHKFNDMPTARKVKGNLYHERGPKTNKTMACTKYSKCYYFPWRKFNKIESPSPLSETTCFVLGIFVPLENFLLINNLCEGCIKLSQWLMRGRF